MGHFATRIERRTEPTLTRRGVINDGFNQELDYLRGIRQDGSQFLIEMEAKERENVVESAIKKSSIIVSMVISLKFLESILIKLL